MEQPSESYKRWKAAEWIENNGEPRTPCEDDFCPSCGRTWKLCLDSAEVEMARV